MEVKDKIPFPNISDQEAIQKLFKFWKVDELKFIGKVTKNNFGYFFNSVLANKRPLKYPDKFGNVGVFCEKGEGLEADKYYEFHCCLAPIEWRKDKGNPYLLNVDTSKPIIPVDDFELTESSKEHFIKHLFNQRGIEPDSSARTARLLRLNELELYTQTERFIFELIQNADDMPKSIDSSVSIEFKLANDYFIFLHNGQPFKKENVEAIADAGKSTKIKDTKKTGYKGIGFKSVFSDAKVVYINSGYFSFRFDSEYYSQLTFEQLYSFHINSLTETAKRNFFRLYEGREPEFTALESIPWQIKPIWTTLKEFPEELKSIQDYFKKEVAIALKIGRETIQNKNYNQILKTLFSEPRFLLFLRKVRNISISSEQISLKVNIFRSGYLKTITSSDTAINKIIRDEYITDEGQYQIRIDNDTFQKVGVPISIHTDGDKSSFKKNDGTDLNNIPEKLAKLDSTSISFAAKIKDEKIVKFPDSEAILFNYLPTNDSRFGFPFLVNADFITTTNRETIIAENLWNVYLFYYIGYYSIQWIADTASIKITDSSKESLRNSILSLLPKMQTDTKEIHQLFNKGFQKGIEEIPFIPCASERTLLKVREAVLDKTKIFQKAIFFKNFKQLFPDKDIVSYSLLYCSDKLCKADVHGFAVTTFEKEDIQKLFQLDDFTPKSNAKHNASLVRHLKENNMVDVLKTFPSIPNQTGQLKMPEELFIYADADDKKSISFDTNFNFISYEMEVVARQFKEIEEILLTDLGVKRFDAATYIQSILNQFSSINKSICVKESNLNFWRFIFKNRNSLSDNDKAKLENFVVITTSEQFVQLKDCFLSSDYQTTYQIEEVANQIGLTGLYFISTSYLQSERELVDFKTLFYRAGAKSSTGWDLYRHQVKALITGNQLTDSNCVIITKFIFDVFRNNRNNFDQAEKNVLRNLKLLTENNGMQPSGSCIFSNPQILKILPDYILDNQVSSGYLATNENHFQQEWKEFLLAAGVSELSEVEIVKKKFEKIISQLNSLDTEKCFTVWRFVFNYSDILTNDNTCKQKLKDIPLPLKNGSVQKCSNTLIYFPAEFKPKSNIEELLDGYYDCFVTPLLSESPTDFDKWKTLLKIVGVQEIISTAGSGNNFEISHIENLSTYEYSLRFWKYFQEHFSVADINTNSKFRTKIISMASIPCLDKGMRKPSEVYPNTTEYKKEINDDTKISGFPFKEDVIVFLGINTDLGELEEDKSYLKYLGNLGERFVYEQIKTEHSNRGVIKENDYGFTIEQNQKVIIEVVWNNKPFITAEIRSLEDSGNPFDISITESKTTNYIEVKTTFRENNVFMMPESEWNWMLANTKSYFIYRVNNVTINPTISVRCLAVEALLNGNIKPKDFPVTITI